MNRQLFALHAYGPRLLCGCAVLTGGVHTDLSWIRHSNDCNFPYLIAAGISHCQ